MSMYMPKIKTQLKQSIMKDEAVPRKTKAIFSGKKVINSAFMEE